MTADIIPLSAAKATRKEIGALNERELVSVYALLAYTAHDQNVSEEMVRAVVANRYGVDDVKNIPSTVFEDVIRFLVDLQVSMLLDKKN